MGRLRYVIAFAFCATVISCAGRQSTPVARPTALPNQAEIVMGVDFNGTYQGDVEVLDNFQGQSFKRSIVVFVDTAEASARAIVGSTTSASAPGSASFVLTNVPLSSTSTHGATDLRHARFEYQLAVDALEISGTVKDFRREEAFGPYLPTRSYQFRAKRQSHSTSSE